MYYPATKAWTVITGWNVGAWAKIKVSGEEKLFYIDSTDDVVYRAWDTSTFDDDDDTGTATAITYTEVTRKEDMGAASIKKIGGELKLTVLATGDYTIGVEASKDDEPFASIGTLLLRSGVSPTLPVDLPFQLAAATNVTGSFHLDSIGEWYTMQFRFIQDSTVGTDLIKIYSRTLTTFPTEYMSEEPGGTASGAGLGYGAGGNGE